jgi:glutathione peroxidase
VSLYDIPITTIDGHEQTLEPFRGRALLIVNVASKCGFTPQYAGLEDLHRQFRDRGFAVLGFPCDQFGHQEPGTEAEIQQFCSVRFGVTFPLVAKINVNGPAAHPLYQCLTAAKRGLLWTRAIKWNFTKFLIDRAGHVVARYSALTPPRLIATGVERLLDSRA